MWPSDFFHWQARNLNYLRNSLLELGDEAVPEVPDWYQGVCDSYQAHIAANMSWAGHILPLSQLAIAAGVVVSLYLVILGIRLTRMLLSLKTGGGGA